MTIELLDYFVLDALSYDIEDLEHVLQILNSQGLGWRSFHQSPFNSQEILPSLMKSVRMGLIEVCVEAEDGALQGLGERTLPNVPLQTVWFRLTPRGQITIDSWEPPETKD